MKTLYSGANVFIDGVFKPLDIEVTDTVITRVSSKIDPTESHFVHSFNNSYIIPGFADVHVHLREPGFSYKETIRTGTLAGARGGYTLLCAMPNLNPPPDSTDSLMQELEIIKRDACITVLPYACITTGGTGRGELVDFDALKPLCFGFSDDGKGVQADELMEEAMRRVAQAGGFIAAHCEDENYLFDGYIHDGEYAKAHGHRGIPSQSEWQQVERDISLVRKTGCRYHVCHVSAKESVELIRRAKKERLPVTCETAPHYLVLTQDDLTEDARFKMNPPLRNADDQQALLAGIADGTIDVIATDHAPHSMEEKSKGLEKSAMGITGLETSFPILYTKLVKTGILTLEKLVDLMSAAPRRIFGLDGGRIEEGQPADFCIINPDSRYKINPDTFLSMGRATPFAGWDVQGEIVMTVCGGKTAWQKN